MYVKWYMTLNKLYISLLLVLLSVLLSVLLLVFRHCPLLHDLTRLILTPYEISSYLRLLIKTMYVQRFMKRNRQQNTNLKRTYTQLFKLELAILFAYIMQSLKKTGKKTVSMVSK